MVELQAKYNVPNELGLHARVASRLVKTCSSFGSTIRFQSDTHDVNAKSVLDVLTLGAEQGAALNIVISGDDAEDAMQAIGQLFANNLGD